MEAGPSQPERTATATQALSGNNISLQLRARTVTCDAKQVRDAFRITNEGTTPVKLSDITVKFWIDDTSGHAIVVKDNGDGCLAHPADGCDEGNDDDEGDGLECFDDVHHVTPTITAFSAACGTDATHQANQEIAISTTDDDLLQPGDSWTGLRISVRNKAGFSPGTADWYSGCLAAHPFVQDVHFAIYVAGALVRTSPGVPPDCRADHGSQQLSGHVPPVIATAPLVGPLPGAAQVTLAFGLPFQHQTDLQPLIQSVTDPASPQYRQYLSPDDFAAHFGPAQSDYDALQQFATSNGLTVTGTYAARSLMLITGAAADVENALFTTLNVYRRSDGTTFYAPANEPSLNLATQLLHVTSLDSYAVPFPSGGTSGACAGSTGFYGQDFRNTYAPCTTGVPQVAGAGQIIALFAPDTYNSQNITTYANGTGLSSTGITLPNGSPLSGALGTNVSQVVVPANGAASSTSNFTTPGITAGFGQAEVEVGMEAVLAMAPLAHLVVYEQDTTTTSGFQPLYILQKMAEPVPNTSPAQVAQVIANSWTWTGGAPSDPNLVQTFQQYAVQGQSFFQAAGDLGAYQSASTGTTPAGAVPEPISDTSLMTVVGGSQVQGTTESTWNNKSERGGFPACNIGQGQQVGQAERRAGTCNSVTGGGVSSLPIPNYQLSIQTSVPGGTGLSTANRMVPDVSIVADGLAAFTCNGTTSPCGTGGAAVCVRGTSGSAALWAGLAALANSANTNYAGPIGFANPQLYSLRAAGVLNPFSDIQDTSDNSYACTTATCNGAQFYSSFVGYDMATGLGSPSASQCNMLIKQLPPQSCMPGTSLSALVTTVSGAQGVVAYVPNGSYGEPATGVSVVTLEGNGPATQVIPTAKTVNTCGVDTGLGLVVCTSNDTDVYFISGTGTPITGQSLATTEQTGSGGSCKTCNVAVDPLHHQAFLSIGTTVGTTTGAFLQRVDLTTSPPTIDPDPTHLIPLNQQTSSEDIVVDTIRGLVLSPNEAPFNGGGVTDTNAGNFQLINTTTGAVYNNTIAALPSALIGGRTVQELDSAAEDCTTGIAVVTDEFTNALLLTDLTQSTFNNTAGTWSTPAAATSFQSYSDFGNFSAGTTGVAMASGTHYGVIAGEFGGNQFAMIQLPATSGVGAPPLGLIDWVAATIPSPDGTNAWQNGEDPHSLTAYQSPIATAPFSSKPYAILVDDFTSSSTTTKTLAIVDLMGLQTFAAGAHTANLTASQTCHGQTWSSGCIVRFVP
jgi:hypothetical protein